MTMKTLWLCNDWLGSLLERENKGLERLHHTGKMRHEAILVSLLISWHTLTVPLPTHCAKASNAPDADFTTDQAIMLQVHIGAGCHHLASVPGQDPLC